MKKTLAYILAMVLIVGGLYMITSLDNSVSTSNDEILTVDLSQYEDCTAQIENGLQIEKNAKYRVVESKACFYTTFTDIFDLYPEAENIVVGEIVDLIYNDDGGIAKTFCSVAVSEVLKGNDIQQNSVITMLEYQGYCRMSKYVEYYGADHFTNYDESVAESTYFVYSIEGEPLIQLGDKFVLFLSDKIEKEGISGCYYGAIGTFMGKYKLNEFGTYARYSPEENYYNVVDNMARNVSGEQPMTLEEIRSAIEIAETR